MATMELIKCKIVWRYCTYIISHTRIWQNRCDFIHVIHFKCTITYIVCSLRTINYLKIVILKIIFRLVRTYQLPRFSLCIYQKSVLKRIKNALHQ